MFTLTEISISLILGFKLLCLLADKYKRRKYPTPDMASILKATFTMEDKLECLLKEHTFRGAARRRPLKDKNQDVRDKEKALMSLRRRKSCYMWAAPRESSGPQCPMLAKMLFYSRSSWSLPWRLQRLKWSSVRRKKRQKKRQPRSNALQGLQGSPLAY